MAGAARSFPNDDTVQVLFAEALMDLSPWNYWEDGGASPKGRTQELVDALERVLERNPIHPGAIHYYIHAMEASTHPEKALPHARRLAKQIPGAGHIVHMSSHIYYRVGLYKDALQANIDAIAIDEKYFRGAAKRPGVQGRLLSAQHPLRDGIGADGRRRQEDAAGFAKAGTIDRP
jgi:tetratricopeptide (TPR) repeat protein